MRKRIQSLTTIVACLAIALGSAWAQVTLPTPTSPNFDNDGGGGDGTWTNTVNWDTDAIPTNTEDAKINDGLTATYDATVSGGAISFGTLTIGAGSTFAYDSDGGINTDFTDGNDIFFANNAQLTVNGFFNSSLDLKVPSGASAIIDHNGQSRYRGSLEGGGNLEIQMNNWFAPRWDAGSFTGNISFTGYSYLRELGDFSAGQVLGQGTNTIGNNIHISQGTSDSIPNAATVVLVGAANGDDEKWNVGTDKKETIANLIIESPTAASSAPYLWTRNGYLTVTDSMTFTGTAGTVENDTYSTTTYPGGIDARGADITFGGTGDWALTGDGDLKVNSSSIITTTTNATISCPLSGAFTKAGSATLTLGDPSGVATPITLSEGSLVFEDNVTFAGGDYITFDDSTSSFTADFGGSFTTLASIEAEIGPADNFRLGSGVSGGLWEYDNGDGTFTVRGDKIIVNREATDILGATATLNGAMVALGTNYTVSVYWGETDRTNNALAWDDSDVVGAWTNVSRTNLNYAATNLTPATTYYFTYLATNDTTNIWASPSLSFTTLDTPVVNNSTGATPVDVTSATLRGQLTGGTLANVWICWGTNDAGILSTGDWDNVLSMGAVSEGSTFTTNVTGLMTNRSYWYRCYAENGLGYDWADTGESFSGTPAGGGSGGSGGPLASNVTLNFDANDPSSGIDDNNWNSTTGDSSQDFDFSTDVTLEEGLSSSGSSITNAYRFTGGAGDANNGTWNGIYGDGSATTWEFWIKPDDTGDADQVIYESGGSGTGFAIWYTKDTDSDDTGTIKLTIDGGSGAQIETVTAEIDTTDFRHTVFVYDESGAGGGTIDLMAVYVDGEFVDDNLSATTDDDAGNDNDNVGIDDYSGGDGSGLGNVNNSLAVGASDGDFDGDIAVFRVWDRALDADEISDNYTYLAGGGSVIANLAPTAVSNYQATANATLSANATNYTVLAYWGTVDAGTNLTWQNVSSPPVGAWTNVASTNISYDISGLTGDTTYYYTFRATNATESVWSEPSWQFATRPNTLPNASIFMFR